MSNQTPQFAETPASPDALREILRDILASPAFKGSKRSQQFLQHIVDKTIHGRADELKERTLGVELFGRPPSYDTGEDAIVRVTASDVRKRLQRYYLLNRPEIRIELDSGAYTPEFRRVAIPAIESKQPDQVAESSSRRASIISTSAIAVAVVCIGLWARQYATQLSISNESPWSRVLKANRQTELVLSDPDISVAQSLMGTALSLSDYANGNYLPALDSFSPDLQRALRKLRGVNVPTVDIGIALNIAKLAETSGARVKTRPARTLKLADFKADGDFIVLGSPCSNPWSGLFQDQLDFDFVYDKNGREMIRNKHALPGELTNYIPTTQGWGTGQAYAIVALVRNPSQSGSVLLLAGTQAEGTEAAGKLATNLEELTLALKRCGTKAPNHFQMLLEVRTMAGSPNTFDVKACHALPHSTTP